jgi:hypothetical protein
VRPSAVCTVIAWRVIAVRMTRNQVSKICAALGCTVADLLEAEPIAGAGGGERVQQAAGAGGQAGAPAGPAPRRSGSRRSLPPN